MCPKGGFFLWHCLSISGSSGIALPLQHSKIWEELSPLFAYGQPDSTWRRDKVMFTNRRSLLIGTIAGGADSVCSGGGR